MKKLETLGFKHFCMTVGNLPSSYVESLSYYECLLWLIKYLQEEVIPTVNNNSEVVAELQEMFIKLQNYVETYFDNLDVQEEVNAKLDEMVEDGTLETLILNYTKLTKVYDTLTDFLADTGVVKNMRARVLGYESINDGGMADYYVTDTASENEYQIELQNSLYGTLLNNFGNTRVYGKDLTALQRAIANSDFVTMYDDLEIAPNTLAITGSKNLVLDMNHHKITMAETTLSYANLINVNTTGNVTIKNGKIDGNLNHHILTEVTNHTGIVSNNGNLNIENMEIYYCYYEGIVVNNGNSKVTMENCYLHHNGRNDVAVLNWNLFKCNNCKFAGAVDNIEPLCYIDIEPYEASSDMGNVEITNCVFENSTKASSVSTYLDQNQTDSANILIANNICKLPIRIGYDRGLRSHYKLMNNQYHNLDNGLIIKYTASNIDIDNDLFINCTNAILFDLYYTWGTIFNVNANFKTLPNSNNSVEFTLPEGTLTYDYPYRDIKIRCTNNNIKNWQYLHSSVLDVPDFVTDSNLTLDFNHYYKNIYLTGYGITCSIDNIYRKSKYINPPITIHSDVSNTVNSALLPIINNNIGASGVTMPGNSSSFSMTFHNHNYNKFIIDNIVGKYNAKN